MPNTMPTMTNPKKVIANSSNNAVLWWVSQDNNLTVNGNLYVNGSVNGCVKTLYESIGTCG